jgi:HSP20 family protein
MALKDLMVWNRGHNVPSHRDFFAPVDSLRKEMDRVFEGLFSDFGDFSSSLFKMDSKPSFSPRLNMSEGDNEIEVSAELPGIEEKDIQVTLKDGVLSIKGEKKMEEKKKEQSFYRVERHYGSFHRSVRIPEGIEADQIKASFRDGVLKINLPKSEKEDKNIKRIEVKSS